LDQLVVLSDDLAKVDQTCETAANKLAENLKNLLGGDMEQWMQNLVVGDSTSLKSRTNVKNLPINFYKLLHGTR
jgi:hypothetical protein